MSFVDGTRIADIPQRRRIVLITFSSLLIVINYEKISPGCNVVISILTSSYGEQNDQQLTAAVECSRIHGRRSPQISVVQVQSVSRPNVISQLVVCADGVDLR